MATEDRAVQELTEMIAGAAPLLRRALWHYYPTGEDRASRIAEEHLSFYVSHVLLGAGLFVYPESRLNKDDKSKHIDFAAFDLTRKVMIAAECKMLSGDGDAAKLAEDAARLRDFSPLPQKGDHAPKHILHLLLALTYDPKNADWWQSEPLKATPEDGPDWEALCNELRSFPVRRAVTVVSQDDDDYYLAMLWAIRKATE